MKEVPQFSINKKVSIDTILKTRGRISKKDTIYIKRAYEFAKNAHKGQKRKTGEDYIIHPMHVAYYISILGMDKETIAAALLHDVLEDCDISINRLRGEFGPTTAKLVSGVTKLRHTSQKKFTSATLDNLRRFLLVAAEDIRVLIIKLADRLHNAQTIEGLTPERQKEYAKEIQYVYSALADYLGISVFKRQFDDIEFKILEPENYKKIENYLDTHHKDRINYINDVTKKIQINLKKNHVWNMVFGREKSISGIYTKIQKYIRDGKIQSESEYGRVYDIFGFRILVKSVEDCYRVLGIVHTTWHPLSSEFDDYIANPKPNGYRSLQTTVFCDGNKLAEIQIRTLEMHEDAEFGPAAHMNYKLYEKKKPLPSAAFGWLSKINIFNVKKDSPKKKDYSIDVFRENIFVLTPTNEVKQLVKGGTPIDFAYSIHTEIGNKCRGAKVNGKLVPLYHKLHTGDQVEILIDKRAEFPQIKWLEFAASNATKNKIKQALRKKEEREAIERGYKKVNLLLKKHETNFNAIYEKYKYELDLLILKCNAYDKESLMARIGFGFISPEKIVHKIFPPAERKNKKHVHPSDIEIPNMKYTRYSIAKCCDPKLGDKIVAVMTVTRGLRIHELNCGFIQNIDKDRKLEAKWK